LLRSIELGYPPIPSLRMVFSTGEMLYPEQRRKIEKALDVRVSDHYGCNEIGAVAFECEFGAKHITEERVLVETLDDSNQPVWEKSGRLVLTDLDNFAMPLIRYEVGDIGVLTRIPCACGRSATVLKSLEGRVQDALRSRDGRILPSLMIASLFRDMTGVKAYQIIQHDFNNLTLKYVPTGRKELESNLDTIGNVIRSQLGAAIQIKLEHCETIPTAASGKIRLVVGMKTDNPRPTPGDGQPPNLNPTPA
jgi:phenylacetate-CoA ligase